MDLRDSKNLLIRRLSSADRARLEPHFTPGPLEFKRVLLEPRGLVSDVFFVETGVVSMVTDLSNGESIETGTVGNEGLVGLSAVLGVSRTSGRAFVQIPGSMVHVPAAVIAGERRQGTEWFQVLLRYANFVAATTAQTAACNRLHAVDARMSRWLLMTHDRVGADEFPLTQEFLAQMLGVARPTVNIAGATLQKAGFIRYTRGRITVIDRRGLESASCECYARIREELESSLNGGAPSRRRTASRRARR